MVIYKGVPVVLVVIDGKAGEIGIESNAFLALIGDLGLVLGNADQLILVAALFFLQEDVSAVRGLCLVQHRVGEDYFLLLRVDVMETASASGKEKSCSKRENFVEHRDTWVIEEDRALLDGFKPCACCKHCTHMTEHCCAGVKIIDCVANVVAQKEKHHSELWCG
mgnify:FL=1